MPLLIAWEKRREINLVPFAMAEVGNSIAILDRRDVELSQNPFEDEGVGARRCPAIAIALEDVIVGTAMEEFAVASIQPIAAGVATEPAARKTSTSARIRTPA